MKLQVKIILMAVCFAIVGQAEAQKPKAVRYRGMVEAGYILGMGDYGENMLGATTSHGVEFPRIGLFAGVGLGYRRMIDGHFHNGYSIPAFVHLRYTPFLWKNERVFVELKLGDNYLQEDVMDGAGSNSGGLYVHPSVGLTTPLGAKTNLIFSLGYAYQHNTYSWPGIPGTSVGGETERNFGGMSFGIGVEF